MKFERPVYYHITDGGRDGPFCQRCWDEKALAARLQHYGDGGWICKVCGLVFYG
jgi:hypothetical protein